MRLVNATALRKKISIKINTVRAFKYSIAYSWIKLKTAFPKYTSTLFESNKSFGHSF